MPTLHPNWLGGAWPTEENYVQGPNGGPSPPYSPAGFEEEQILKAVPLWRRLPLALVILVVGIALTWALMTLKPRPEPRPEPEPPPALVDVVRVELEDRSLPVITQGTVEPLREIQLVSQVSGRVREVAPNYVSGGSFEEGDWLIQIDPRDYEFALARADAQLAEAEQLLATERGRVRQAEREWRDLGDESANQLFLRKPQLAAAEANVKAARAERDRAQLELERTRVTAPFRGRIRETLVNKGQSVSPGTQIATIYDAAVAQVRLPLSGHQAALVDLPLGFERDQEPFPSVLLRGEVAGEPHQWRGEIIRTHSSLDSQTRMYEAIAEVREPFSPRHQTAPLLIGLFVEAEISGRQLKNIAVLPRSAVFQRDQIYTLNEENIVQAKTVQILKVEPDQLWVRGDLSQGEAVIRDRQGYVSPGVEVDILGENEENSDPEKALEDSAAPSPEAPSSEVKDGD